MIIRLENNPKIVVRADQYPSTVTGYTGTQVVGSGATVVTSTGVNPVIYNIYTPIGGSATWGNIVGTLSGQTDLQQALDLKLDISDYDTYTGTTQSTIEGIQSDITGNTSLIAGNTADISYISGITDTKLASTVFSTYTGTTAPAQFAPINATDDMWTSGQTIDYVTGYTPTLDGYWNSGQTVSYVQGLNYLTGVTWNEVTGKPDLWTSAQTVSYINSQGFITSLAGYWTSAQTESWVNSQGFITDISTKLDTSVFNTYTGTTVPNLLLGYTATGITETLRNDFNSHSGDSTIHFTQAAISIAQSQVSDLVTDLSTLNDGITGNTAALNLKASQADLNTHSGNTAIHFEQSAIQIAQTQVDTLPTDLAYLQQEIDNLSALQSTSSLFIFEHTDSDISGYEVLNTQATNYSATTETIALTAGAGETSFEAYITPATGLAVTGITSGSWSGNFHAYTSSVVGGRETYMRFKFYRRDTGGTETLLWTSQDLLIDSTTIKEFQFNETQVEFTGFSSTDRLVVKIFGVQTGLDGTLYWTYGTNPYNSFISVPIISQTAPLWANVAAKPQWLDYTTLSGFQTGHTHSYNNLTDKPTLFTGNTFVASGGTVLDLTGDVLTIYSPTGGTGGGTWGSITGTLSGQTDLYDALQNKVDIPIYQDDLQTLSDAIDINAALIPSTFANALSGVTNLGSGTTIGSTSGQNVTLKSFSVGVGLALTGDTDNIELYSTASAVWGQITGTLSGQTDLQTVLNDLQTSVANKVDIPIYQDDLQTLGDKFDTGLAGTKEYWVSDTSGGTATRKLTFINGLLVSED